MDREEINRELARIGEEIETLEARRGHTLARPLDPPAQSLQTRLEDIERRIVAIEPVAIEHAQLVGEAEQLRGSAAPKADSRAICSANNRTSDIATSSVWQMRSNIPKLGVRCPCSR